MYNSQGINDILFLMSYGGVAMYALITGLYLLFRRGNAIDPSVSSSKILRQWAAAFMFSVVASHLWWPLVGLASDGDDKLIRIIIVEVLDYITVFPLIIVVMIYMLQDRKREIWPIAVGLLPVVMIAVIGLVTRYEWTEIAMAAYTLLASIAFIIYMVRAVRQYGRWLRDNYADMEHKEVWQSLLLLVAIILIYLLYAFDSGSLLLEYLNQINSVVSISFIVWRVETLQKLDCGCQREDWTEKVVSQGEERLATGNSEACEEKESVSASTSTPSNIGSLLEKHCEEKKIYLLNDLSLSQLALHIGTNRTYLSAYFAQQGITYNTYINRLRIEYFIKIYREQVSSLKRPLTAQQLAELSGYKSYSTFSAAFKKIMGENVTTWMKSENGS